MQGRIELPRVTGVRYCGFVDPSGGSADSMTLAIAHLDVRFVLDLVREVKPPFSPEKIVKEFAGVLRSYGISTVIGDHYAGEWPRERFSTYGITYRPAKKSRSDIYLEMLPMLNSKQVFLLDNPRLVAQLAGLERHAARGGRETIDHAPGGHDDLANAAAGALVYAAHSVLHEGFGGFIAVNTKGGGQIIHAQPNLPPGVELDTD